MPDSASASQHGEGLHVKYFWLFKNLIRSWSLDPQHLRKSQAQLLMPVTLAL